MCTFPNFSFSLTSCHFPEFALRRLVVLPTYAAQFLRTWKTSTAPLRKPEFSHLFFLHSLSLYSRVIPSFFREVRVDNIWKLTFLQQKIQCCHYYSEPVMFFKEMVAACSANRAKCAVTMLQVNAGLLCGQDGCMCDSHRTL